MPSIEIAYFARIVIDEEKKRDEYIKNIKKAISRPDKGVTIIPVGLNRLSDTSLYVSALLGGSLPPELINYMRSISKQSGNGGELSCWQFIVVGETSFLEQEERIIYNFESAFRGTHVESFKNLIDSNDKPIISTRRTRNREDSEWFAITGELYCITDKHSYTGKIEQIIRILKDSGELFETRSIDFISKMVETIVASMNKEESISELLDKLKELPCPTERIKAILEDLAYR